NIDKRILIAIANAVSEPAMYPLSSRDRPGVSAVVTTFGAEKNFHPNNRRPSQRLFPLRHAQRGFAFGRGFQREFVFAGRPLLPARIERVTRPADTDRIDFLRVT